MKEVRRILTVLCLAVCACLNMSAQRPGNDVCFSAFDLPRVQQYCSEPGEFSNAQASSTGPIPGGCLNELTSEVWFTFIPIAPAVVLEINGAVSDLGTMRGPGVLVFSGGCNNRQFEGCNTVAQATASVELTISDLVLGQVYYVAVIGVEPGTFQICMSHFTPPPTPEQDCDDAVILCDKSPFFVERITGTGDPLFNEVSGTCILRESASVWYKWTCEESGSLTFTLTPNNWVEGFESDDLDFVLFELTGGLDDCDPPNRVPIRCMASGANTLNGAVLPLSEWAQCNGATGLREGESDQQEELGCLGLSNNFAAPAMLDSGKSYALVINNYSNSGQGFSIEFGGTATFRGPEPDFAVDAVQAFECDKTIIFTNESFSDSDPIVAWEWNFGAGAMPINASGTGPHDVVYESFGDKIAALTVESSRGCQVTKVIELFVDACCQDTSTLAAAALSTDELCPGANDGTIEAFGSGGVPNYAYSLDGTTFGPSPVIASLPPGTYELTIRDQKGCQAKTNIDVGPADPYSVSVGDTIVAELGQTVRLEAIPDPYNFVNVSWTPSGSLSFDIDSLHPLAIPPGSTSYMVTVINAGGCVATDTVFVEVDVVRPVYIPNVFSPNADGVNDIFYVSGGAAVAGIEMLRVFNRWGGLVYERIAIPAGAPELGWDGMIDGQMAENGVYTYHAQVLFVDNVQLDYSGTITVLR